MNHDDTMASNVPGQSAPSCQDRRNALRIAACACAGLGLNMTGAQPAFADEPAEKRPTQGDRLVAADASGQMRPLTPADIKPGAKPLMAFPLDATQQLVRDGSRLNKVALVRMDPASLDPEVRARAADGVLAFSAICTHQGCEVSEWNAAEKALLCFCHFSRFDPARLGQVVAGPASRSLPNLPLAIEEGQLIVAAPFSSRPGVKA